MSGIKRRRIERATALDQFGNRFLRQDTSPYLFFKVLKQLKGTWPTAEEYLKLHHNLYPWSEHWLRHGESFTPPTEKDQIEKILEGLLLHEGRCYQNSLALGLTILKERPDVGKYIHYVEGLAIDPTGVYPHGWLAIGKEVFDWTWPSAHLATYFGVRFDLLFARDTFNTVGKGGMINLWDEFSNIVIPHLNERLTVS